MVNDSSGRMIRKFKESELKRTEFSPYLAIDECRMYLDYTPPVYPITITYEWTIDSKDNLIEFPPFNPLTDYDVCVKHASYRLKAPKSLNIRHAMQNINGAPINVNDYSSDARVFSLELHDLPMLKKEPYARPFHERIPVAWFAPSQFTYYGIQGSLHDWRSYGQWEYDLLCGLDSLPAAVCQELHQLTDTLKSDREKVEVLYKRLEKTTRYVAILLGIGGQKPASAIEVNKSGFGDCKGLSNYMRAMLKEVGINSNYTTISTVNRHLLKDFASIGQVNHVILQVPLENDTLWLECTHPQLPMGYLHRSIAGHDAIEISEQGGRFVQLPTYPDSTNLKHSIINIKLDTDGTANMTIEQKCFNHRYEEYVPLIKMDEEKRQKTLRQMMNVPQAEFTRLTIKSCQSDVKITLNAEVRSPKYAIQTGHRLFIPIYPMQQKYTINTTDERKENIYWESGHLNNDDITFYIPDGYTIETLPENLSIELPFGAFEFSVESHDRTIHITNRLLMKSGSFDKSLIMMLNKFIQDIQNTYHQKIVLKQTSITSVNTGGQEKN